MEKLTKNNNYLSQKNDVIFHIFDQIKVFKITVVNWALPSLHVIGSLDITLTVPLNGTLNVGTIPPLTALYYQHYHSLSRLIYY